MSHRARLLHILASAPVVAVLATAQAPSVHAQTQDARPARYVVAVDAGHGGTPDNNHPDVPFDPGVIGPTGLLEKDVTLDVAERVERRLTDEGAAVVMTRTGDRYVDIAARMQSASDGHASLFVSMHMNSFPDTGTGGATVLYPGPASVRFAKVMSDAMGTGLSGLGIADDGIQLKDDLWVHATMPAVTVEGAYLSNPREEALMKQPMARDALAGAIVAGIDAQAPEIATRSRAIAAWDAAHRPLTVAAATGGAVALAETAGSGTRNVVLFVVAMLVWWRRRVVVPFAWRTVRFGWRVCGLGGRALLSHTAQIRSKRSARGRRRRRLDRGRRHPGPERSDQLSLRHRPAGRLVTYRSVYDDLNL